VKTPAFKSIFANVSEQMYPGTGAKWYTVQDLQYRQGFNRKNTRLTQVVGFSVLDVSYARLRVAGKKGAARAGPHCHSRRLIVWYGASTAIAGACAWLRGKRRALTASWCGTRPAGARVAVVVVGVPTYNLECAAVNLVSTTISAMLSSTFILLLSAIILISEIHIPSPLYICAVRYC
jgi:hypothetical protein